MLLNNIKILVENKSLAPPNLTIKLSVKLSKFNVLTPNWAKTQGIIKKPRWVKNKGKKYNLKCIDFDASSSFTLCFSISLPCALMVGFLSLVCLDKVVVSSMNEKCFKLQVWRFKLQMWSVDFLSEWQLLWMKNV